MFNGIPARCLIAILVLFPAARLCAQGREAVWRKVEAENFTVLSALGEKETAKWAAEFVVYIGTLKRFITLDARRLPPITIVLFARDRDFHPYRVVGPNGRTIDLAGFFSRRESWAVAGLVGGASSEETRRVIFHEGVHWFFSAFHRPNPVWIEEGVAEVFSTFSISRKKMTWGQGIDGHAFLLQMNSDLSLERLLNMDRRHLFHGGGLPAGVLYAQSWALAHYLMFGKHDLPPDALERYLNLYHSAIHPDEAFKQAFGVTPAVMQDRLERYVHGGKYLVFDAPLPEMPLPEVTEAEPIEVQIGLARLAVASQRLERAKEHAEKSVALLPDDPRGYEMLGIVRDESGDRPGAVQAYQAAVERGSKDFRSTFQLGLALQTGAESALTADDARGASRYYQLSINLHPYQLYAYRNLAILTPLLAAPTEQDRKFLEFGYRLFPDDAMIVLGLAVLGYKQGERESALGLVRRVLKNEDRLDRPTREFAHRLDDAWTYTLVMEKAKEAAAGQRYAEAVGLLGEAIDSARMGPGRAEFARLRREYAARDRLKQAQAALEVGEHERAKELAGEIVASEAPATVKSAAQQVLNRAIKNLRR